jgi:P-type conjugative transfer protein TrbL
MPPSGSTLLAQLLNAFIFTLTGGYARTVGEVYGLLVVLATIELIVAGTTWFFLRTGFLAEMFWKIFGFAFLFWVVEQWPVLLKGLRDGFIEAGLLVGGSVLTITDITDPGNLIDFGFSVTALLFGKLTKLNFLTNGFIIIFGGITGWLVVLFYMFMAAHLFMAILEYYIVGACLLILVPFLAHQKTAFIGEGVFGTFFAHAMRLLIYAAVLSSALPVLYTYNLPLDPGWHDMLMLFAATLILFAVSVTVPQLAHGIQRGAAVFSFSNLLLGASTFAQTSAAVGAVGAAASVAGAGALRGAVSGASAMREAAQMGAATYRASGRSGVAGGAAGMGQYAVGRLTSGFRDAVSSGRARARDTMP